MPDPSLPAIPALPVEFYSFMLLRNRPLVWFQTSRDHHVSDALRPGTKELFSKAEGAKRELAAFLGMHRSALKFCTKVEIQRQIGVRAPLHLKSGTVALVHPDVATTTDVAILPDLLVDPNAEAIRMPCDKMVCCTGAVLISRNPLENIVLLSRLLDCRKSDAKRVFDIKGVCSKCHVPKPIAGSGVSDSWVCSDCSGGNSGGLQVAHRALMAYKHGRIKERGTAEICLGGLLRHAVKRGHAEVVVLVADELQPLPVEFLNLALRSCRIGVLSAVLSRSDPKAIAMALRRTERKSHPKNPIDFPYEEVRTRLQTAWQLARVSHATLEAVQDVRIVLMVARQKHLPQVARSLVQQCLQLLRPPGFLEALQEVVALTMYLEIAVTA